MHMSDPISAAFGDVSEVSCHWGLRRSLFNSAGGAAMSRTLWSLSPLVSESERCTLNKRAPVSPVGGFSTVLHQEDS